MQLVSWRLLHDHAVLRLRVKIMGLIIIRTDRDPPFRFHIFPVPLSPPVPVGSRVVRAPWHRVEGQLYPAHRTRS
jgi:hypothetical protein